MGKLFAAGRNVEGQCANNSSAKILKRLKPCCFDISELMEQGGLVLDGGLTYEKKDRKERRRERRKMERAIGNVKSTTESKKKKKSNTTESLIVTTFCIEDFCCGGKLSYLLCDNRRNLMISGTGDFANMKSIQTRHFTSNKEMGLRPGQKQFTSILANDESCLLVVDKRFIYFNTPVYKLEFDILSRFGCYVDEIQIGDNNNSFIFTTNSGRIYRYNQGQWFNQWNATGTLFYNLMSMNCVKMRTATDPPVTLYSNTFQTNISDYDRSEHDIFPAYLCYFEYDRENKKIYSHGSNIKHQQGIGEAAQQNISDSPNLHEDLTGILETSGKDLSTIVYGQFYTVAIFGNPTVCKYDHEFKSKLHSRSMHGGFADLEIFSLCATD